jgi:hypothetical protein
VAKLEEAPPPHVTIQRHSRGARRRENSGIELCLEAVLAAPSVGCGGSPRNAITLFTDLELSGVNWVISGQRDELERPHVSNSLVHTPVDNMGTCGT